MSVFVALQVTHNSKILYHKIYACLYKNKQSTDAFFFELNIFPGIPLPPPQKKTLGFVYPKFQICFQRKSFDWWTGYILCEGGGGVVSKGNSWLLGTFCGEIFSKEILYRIWLAGYIWGMVFFLTRGYWPGAILRRGKFDPGQNAFLSRGN